MDSKISLNCPYTVAEIVHLIQNERVVHLSDIVLRRTALAITGQISMGIIERIAAIMAVKLGWDKDQTNQEISTLTSELNNYHGVSLQTLSNRSQ